MAERRDDRVGGDVRRFLGVPEDALRAAWTVRDVQEYLQVSERKARQLLHSPYAPPPLRLGSQRCDRWNPYQLLAWLHGVPEAVGGWTPMDEPASPDLPPATSDSGGDVSGRTVPGTRWRPDTSSGLPGSPARARKAAR